VLFRSGFDHQRCEEGAAIEQAKPPLTTMVDIERAYVTMEAERRKASGDYPIAR